MQNHLYTALKKYAQSNPIRFHMPAHNGIDLGIDTSMDITELSFSDNLIESDGIIKNCENNIYSELVYHKLVILFNNQFRKIDGTAEFRN